MADGELIEVSRNFVAQAPDGTVCYFGEDVDIYEGGAVVSHEGQWRAGVSGALPGIVMPASPAVGMAFRQEVAPGVAEDRVELKAVRESVTVPAGTFANTIRVLESSQLDPRAATTKVYARGVGLIVADVLRLTSRTPSSWPASSLRPGGPGDLLAAAAACCRPAALSVMTRPPIALRVESRHKTFPCVERDHIAVEVPSEQDCAPQSSSRRRAAGER